MEMDSITIRAKNRPSLLSLLISRTLTVVAKEGVPYRHTIFRGEISNTCLRAEILFPVREL